MKLRNAFPTQQLLSIPAAVICAALALALAVPCAWAQATGSDTVTLKTNPPQQKVGVLITGVVSGRVMIRESSGEVGYDLSQVGEVIKAPPAEFTAGLQAIELGKLDLALPQIKAVADKFIGLPTAWAKDSVAMLGNIYISLGKLPEAEIAIKDFKAAYAGSDSAASNVAEARLAAARRQFDKAKSLAEPIVAGAMQKKNVSRTDSQLYGQAFFVLGQCAEGENKLPEAMENYCRTVAVFYQEPSVVADAQKRIDELRQKGVTTP